MSTKKNENRWNRWNKLMIDKKFIELVKEFDKMVKNKDNVTVGDLVLRDEALEELGIASLSPNALYKRKERNERSRTRKY